MVGKLAAIDCAVGKQKHGGSYQEQEVREYDKTQQHVGDRIYSNASGETTVAVPDPLIANVNSSGFYQTPNSMTIKAIRAKLTAADWTLWSYLQMLDPFGDRMKELPKVSEIASVIQISIRQVKRSLTKLKELGLYIFESAIVKGQNVAGKLVKEICQKKRESKFSTQDRVTELPTNGQKCPGNDKSVQSMTELPTNGQKCPNQAAKLAPSEASSTPQTNKTYKDFTNTLSDSERENFEKFVRQEWRELTARNGEPGQEIVSIERFLAREEDLKNWYERFLNSPTGLAAKKAALDVMDWTQHSDWSDWLAMMREGVPRFVALGTCFDRKTRRAIADWALERGLIWGVG